MRGRRSGLQGALQSTSGRLPQTLALLPLLAGFSAVYLLDSSSIALPDAFKQEFPGYGGDGAGAGAKLFLLLDWLSGAYAAFKVQAGRKADQNMGEEFLSEGLPGALWLFDLGFFNLGFLRAITASGSSFLCRRYQQVRLGVVNSAGAIVKLDLDELLAHAPKVSFAMGVVLGPQPAVAARLIVAPVPESVKRLQEVAAAAQEAMLEDVPGYLQARDKSTVESKALFDQRRKVRPVKLSPQRLSSQVSSASVVMS